MDNTQFNHYSKDVMAMAQNEVVNRNTIWLLFLFLGWSYGSMYQMGMQILYYFVLVLSLISFTELGHNMGLSENIFGIVAWTLVRLFTLNKAITDYNNNIYMKYGLNEMIK